MCTSGRKHKKWTSLLNSSYSSTNFQLKLTIVIFWTRFVKKGSYYFWSKTDKINTTTECCIFELVFVSNFTLSNFEFLNQICPRKIFMVRNRKIEHHHCIPLIQISLGTKFQLKLTILIFLTTFTEKGFFWSKTEKVNTTYFLRNSAYPN